MKCKKCDISYKNEEKYCEKCGAKLVKEEIKEVKNEKKENKLLKKIEECKDMIIGVLITLIIVLLVCNIVAYITGPVFKAKKYFNAVINNDCAEIIKLSNKENTELLNNDILSKKMTKTKNVSNVKIINKKVYKNEALVTFEYMEDKEEKTAFVLLKNLKKTIINNWQVESGKIASNVTFKLPKDSKIKLDNIDLGKYKVEEDSSYAVYKISDIPTGEYNVEIELLDKTKIEEKINISSDVNYRVSNIEFESDKKEKFNMEAKEMINSIYQNLIKDSDLDSNYSEDIIEYYKDLRYYYRTSKNKLSNVDIKDASLKNAEYIDGKYVLTFRVEYSYGIDYQDGHYDGINRSYVTVSFGYDTNNIENIDLSNMTFKIIK